MIPKLLFFPFAFLLLFITGCSSTRNFIDDGQEFSFHCPAVISEMNPEIIDSAEVSSDSLLNTIYSYENLEVANAFGLLDDLIIYESLRRQIRREGRVDPATFDEFTKAYNRINEGMNLAALELKSLEDLIECTILKLRKYKLKVASSNLKKQNSLSNWAIGVGSATTILTAGILLSQNDNLIGSTAFDWMAVAGGVATGYLAYSSSRVNRQINLNPRNNFIKVVWTGDNADNLIPPSTWYLLNKSFDFNGVKTTLRERILNEWSESPDMLGNEANREFIPLLTADRGVYTEELIDLRIEMVETIGLGVDQINRALYLFNSNRY